MSDIVAYARVVDYEQDFFEDYINYGTVRTWTPWTIGRDFPPNFPPEIRGDEWTKLLVGPGMDVMDVFP